MSRKRGSKKESTEEIQNSEEEMPKINSEDSSDILNLLNKMNITLNNLAKGQASLEAKFTAFETKLLNLETTVKDLEESANFTSNEVTDMKSTMNSIQASSTESHELAVKSQERIDDLERYSRSFNLRFIGIPEQTDREDCSRILEELITSTIHKQVDIENAHRTGKQINDKPRVILAKFLRRPERYEVLRNKKIFRKGNVLIFEDLIQKDLQSRKLLAAHAEQAHKDGKKVRFSKGNLFIDGVKFLPK